MSHIRPHLRILVWDKQQLFRKIRGEDFILFVDSLFYLTNLFVNNLDCFCLILLQFFVENYCFVNILFRGLNKLLNAIWKCKVSREFVVKFSLWKLAAQLRAGPFSFDYGSVNDIKSVFNMVLFCSYPQHCSIFIRDAVWDW